MFQDIDISVLLAKPIAGWQDPDHVVGKWYYPFTPVPASIVDDMYGTFQINGVDYTFRWVASDAIEVEAVA